MNSFDSTSQREQAIDDAFIRLSELQGEERAFALRALSSEIKEDVEALLKSDAIVADDFLGNQSESHSDTPVIAGLQIIRSLGEGGMGVVYLAREESSLGRNVAVKVIRLLGESRRIIERFRAEQETLALMDHPNIARILGAGVTAADQPYFVMEHIAGVSITRYCDENRLSVRERLGLFDQVCDAIHHAHQKGIIHRDIKPSNVLVTTVDERPTVKVIDFGIAKAIAREDDAAARLDLTQMDEFLGTIRYMSPEQAVLGNPDIDTRSDVYSLGVLLYELLTEATPLGEAELKQQALDVLLASIREDDVIRPSQRIRAADPQTMSRIESWGGSSRSMIAELTGELDWITLKALEKDRRRRYQGAASLQEDVRRYLDNRVVLARPPSAFYRTAKFVRRNRVLVTTVGLFGVALLVSMIGLVVANQTAIQEAKRARDAETQVQQQVEVITNSRDELRKRNGQLSRAFDVGYAMLESRYIGNEENLLVAALDGMNEAGEMEQLSSQDQARLKLFLSVPIIMQLQQKFNLENAFEPSVIEQFEELKQSLNQALELDPELDLAYLARAQLNTEAKRAVAELNWIAQQPLKVFLSTDDSVQADWDEAVRRMPLASLAHSGRAFWRHFQGDAAGSRSDAQRALQLDPNNEFALRKMAELDLKSGNIRSAVEYHRRRFYLPRSVGDVLFGRRNQDDAGNEIAAWTIKRLLPTDDAPAVDWIEPTGNIRFFGIFTNDGAFENQLNAVWSKIENAIVERATATSPEKDAMPLSVADQIERIHFPGAMGSYLATCDWTLWLAVVLESADGDQSKADRLREKFNQNHSGTWPCEMTPESMTRLLAILPESVLAEQRDALRAAIDRSQFVVPTKESTMERSDAIR